MGREEKRGRREERRKERGKNAIKKLSEKYFNHSWRLHANDSKRRGREQQQGGIQGSRRRTRAFQRAIETRAFFSLLPIQLVYEFSCSDSLCTRYILPVYREHLIPPVGHGVETPGCSQDGLNATPILPPIEPLTSPRLASSRFNRWPLKLYPRIRVNRETLEETRWGCVD